MYNAVYLTANAVQELSENSAWVVDSSGANYSVAYFGGDEWEYYPSLTHQTLSGLTFPTSSQAWAVGENVILRYDNPGTEHRLYLPLILTK